MRETFSSKRRLAVAGITTICVLAVAMPALAGPPFICHPFEIGSAKSLPWGASNNYMGMRDDYDFSHVVADTEMLLTPSMPTLVRMETLRHLGRAAPVARQGVRAAPRASGTAAGEGARPRFCGGAGNPGARSDRGGGLQPVGRGIHHRKQHHG